MNSTAEKKPEVTAAGLLAALRAMEPDKPVITSKALVRPQTFEGRRAGETREFTKQRKKNRVRNKLARQARKR